LTQELSSNNNRAKSQKPKAQIQKQMGNAPNLNKNNNVEVLKMKNLTMTDYEITKLIPQLFSMKNYI
jgi:hypothetical protein